MDKIEFLKKLSNAHCFSLLSNGELKLYILLLINASDVDTIEKISLKQIEKANGTIPSLSELKTMMASLERYGLTALERIAGWPAGKLIFRLKRPVEHSAGVNKRHRVKKWQKK